MKVQKLTDKNFAKKVTKIHMDSFKGFFLTFLGKGFLETMYKGFIIHKDSEVLGAFDKNGELVGFLAYSEKISDFYKFLIKKYLLPFGWYSFIATIKNPKIIFRLLRAFTYSEKSKRDDSYIELSSIGVHPDAEGKGVGSALIEELKKNVDFSRYAYIKLETDCDNNIPANEFYKKNGFVLDNTYQTAEGRRMNEYHYYEPEKVNV